MTHKSFLVRCIILIFGTLVLRTIIGIVMWKSELSRESLLTFESYFDPLSLLLITIWLFFSYSQKNQHLVEKSEKWKLMSSIFISKILICLILTSLHFSADFEFDILSKNIFENGFNFFALLFGIAIIVFTNSFIIIIGEHLVRKYFTISNIFKTNI